MCERYLVLNPKDCRVVVVESFICSESFRNTLAKVLFQHLCVSTHQSLSLQQLFLHVFHSYVGGIGRIYAKSSPMSVHNREAVSIGHGHRIQGDNCSSCMFVTSMCVCVCVFECVKVDMGSYLCSTSVLCA